MKKLICIFLAICLPISLVSCAEGESAQLRTGQRLMKGYLSDRDENAVLTESHADVLRPAADQLVLSDYVKGTFRDGGASYEITVNVVTGEIYTSERLPEFAESCIRLIEERLGLNPGDCVGNCSVMELYAPAWQKENPEWPWERAYLGRVLPVGLRDMDAYAAQALSNGDVRLVMYLACRDTDIGPERWTEADIADWDNTEVTLLALTGPGAALPSSEELTVDYRNSFAGDRLQLSDRGIAFQPGT